MKIDIIAKEMTREEFKNHLVNYGTVTRLKINDDVYGCPKNIGLPELDCRKHENTCEKCWLKAVENVKFKGEIETETTNKVNHPQHYNTGKFEVIDVIEDWNMGFNLGNAIKYIARCKHKGKKKEDLEKAIWYLNREIINTEEGK